MCCLKNRVFREKPGVRCRGKRRERDGVHVKRVVRFGPLQCGIDVGENFILDVRRTTSV